MNKIIIVTSLALFAFYIHNGSQETRQQIQAERACLEAAKGRAETDACIKQMKLNIANR